MSKKYSTKQLENALLTLVGRLYDEDEDTFAYETLEVMRRWKPVFKDRYLKPSIKPFKVKY